MLIGVKNADAVHEADNGLGSLLHEAGRCRKARRAEAGALAGLYRGGDTDL
jgi:hypothetical protein